jgi:hypothetical protein
MNNTHEDKPEIFQTRWALSYLRGPLTRDQIKTLMDPLKASGLTGTNASPVPKAIPASSTSVATNNTQPAALPPDVPTYYLPARGSGPSGSKLSYLPRILGAAKINLFDSKTRINLSESKVYVTTVTDNAIPVTWDHAQEINIPATDLEKSPQLNALFGELPSAAMQGKNYTVWNRDFNNWLYGTQKVDLFSSPSLKEVSQPGETESAFRIRLGQSSRERRDEMVAQLRDKYASKISVLQDRLRRAQQAEAKQAEQARQAKFQTAISFGSTLLKGVGRAMDESKDVSRAGETVAAIQQQLTDLQAEFDSEAQAVQERTDPTKEVLETIQVKPNKSDISVQLVALVWMPHWQDSQGNITPAW